MKKFIFIIILAVIILSSMVSACFYRGCYGSYKSGQHYKSGEFYRYDHPSATWYHRNHYYPLNYGYDYYGGDCYWHRGEGMRCDSIHGPGETGWRTRWAGNYWWT